MTLNKKTEDKLEKIAVIGAGIMGAGIAQVCALSGYSVILMDIKETQIDSAIRQMERSLTKMEQRGQIKEDPKSILKRIERVSSVTELQGAHFVIEAIIENIQVKRALFEDLARVCGINAILCSNTSSIPITEIATGLERPERIVGIHFFNPAHRMKLVEIVRGLLTSDATVAVCKKFVASLEKESVIVNKDNAGFIVNRVNGAALLEALRVFEAGIASVADIDKAMRLGLGHALGPFELMDLVGLDTVLRVRMQIYDETGDPRYFPPITLRRMVASGHLGRKTKKGFYDYP